MRQPLPLGVIYQPTRLQMAFSRTVTDENGRTWGRLEPQEISESEFLKDRVNSMLQRAPVLGKPRLCIQSSSAWRERHRYVAAVHAARER
jgi:hypothetical protein